MPLLPRPSTALSLAGTAVCLSLMTGCETFQTYDPSGVDNSLGYEAPANPNAPANRNHVDGSARPSDYNPPSELTNTIERLQRENRELREENAELQRSLQRMQGM